MSNLGYVSFIKEIELGWGDRPDGFVISLNRETGEEFVNKAEAFDRVKYPHEFSVASDFKICSISDKAKEEIEESEKKAIWIRPKDFNDYILDL